MIFQDLFLLSQRNMKYFAIKERDLEKSQFKELKKNSNKYYLTNKGFHTHYEGLQRIIHFVTNDYEFTKVFTSADHLFFELSKYTDAQSFSFNKGILTALNDLYYFNAMKMQYDKSVALPFIEFNEEPAFLDGVDLMSINDYKIDEFGIFMQLYGKTIANDFKED